MLPVSVLDFGPEDVAPLIVVVLVRGVAVLVLCVLAPPSRSPALGRALGGGGCVELALLVLPADGAEGRNDANAVSRTLVEGGGGAGPMGPRRARGGPVAGEVLLDAGVSASCAAEDPRVPAANDDA